MAQCVSKAVFCEMPTTTKKKKKRAGAEFRTVQTVVSLTNNKLVRIQDELSRVRHQLELQKEEMKKKLDKARKETEDERAFISDMLEKFQHIADKLSIISGPIQDRELSTGSVSNYARSIQNIMNTRTDYMLNAINDAVQEMLTYGGGCISAADIKSEIPFDRIIDVLMMMKSKFCTPFGRINELMNENLKYVEEDDTIDQFVERLLNTITTKDQEIQRMRDTIALQDQNLTQKKAEIQKIQQTVQFHESDVKRYKDLLSNCQQTSNELNAGWGRCRKEVNECESNLKRTLNEKSEQTNTQIALQNCQELQTKQERVIKNESEQRKKSESAIVTNVNRELEKVRQIQKVLATYITEGMQPTALSDNVMKANISNVRENKLPIGFPVDKLVKNVDIKSLTVDFTELSKFSRFLAEILTRLEKNLRTSDASQNPKNVVNNIMTRVLHAAIGIDRVLSGELSPFRSGGGRARLCSRCRSKYKNL